MFRHQVLNFSGASTLNFLVLDFVNQFSKGGILINFSGASALNVPVRGRVFDYVNQFSKVFNLVLGFWFRHEVELRNGI